MVQRATTTQEPGLRERKKQQTRELIAESARRLFTERGFESVTVVEVARNADVSEQTVFNYFPTKEDLVFWGLGSFEERLLAAVRGRDPGQSVLDAFREFLRSQPGLLGRFDPKGRERLAAISRVITDSPALRAREQQILDGYTDSLSTVIVENGDAGEVEAWVAANALVGVHRSLIGLTRSRILAGDSQPKLARRVKAEMEKAFTMLESRIGELGATADARSGND